MGCQNYYIKKGSKPKSKYNVTSLYYDYNKPNTTISAPTLSQAAKWLREVKGLFIEITLETPGYFWEVKKCNDPSSTIMSGEHCTTYEAALNKGINAVLKI